MAENKRGRIRAYSGQHIRFRPPGPREDRLRKVNDLKCWAFFSNFKGCAVCINSCPFHRFGYDAERRAHRGAD